LIFPRTSGYPDKRTWGIIPLSEGYNDKDQKDI
jgi:hypothetical protein